MKLSLTLRLALSCLVVALAAFSPANISLHRGVMRQAAYPGYGLIQAANTASLPTPGSSGFTAQSSVTATLPSNCLSVAVSVILPQGQSSWAGQLHVYGSTGIPQAPAGVTLNPRYDQIDGVMFGTTAIPANATGTFIIPAFSGSVSVVCTSLSSGTPYIVIAPGPAASASQSGNISVGKADTLLAASQLGNISGTYVSGAHKLAQIIGENASSVTVYLLIFDATSQPSNGTVPVAEITVPFGISTAPSSSRVLFSPDWVGTSTGVWFCFSTAPGAFNSSNLVSSGTGLLVRIYGQ